MLSLHNMQGLGVLMIGLLYVHLCIRGGEAASDATAIDFVATIGKEVQAIAAKVEENDAKRCELANTCQCSRVECLPRKNENNLPGSRCVYTDNNTACPSKNNSPCTSIRANFLEGYVRIPRLDFKFGNSIEGVVGNTVCAHSSKLDSTFRTVYENLEKGLQRIGQSNLRTLYTIYFGAVDGSNRYFPGLETINQAMCSKYEPRSRPWYTGAISVVKDLVILLDTGFDMLQTFSDLANVNSSSLLEVAKSMTASVMKTLTANDRANIVPFNESVSPGNKTWLVPGKGFSNDGPPELQDFLDSVDPGSAQPEPALASNFTAGFLKASSIFNDPGSPDQALKIVILITDGNGLYQPSQQDLQTALDFEKQGVRLFVYEIPKGDLNYTSRWASVCCRIGGYNEKLDKFSVVVNPMSSLNSYFSFLARSHIAAQGTIKPFWQVGYVATNGLGNLTSAAYLAMSADRLRLIGVVGINIQIAGFIDKDLIARVQSYLFANKFTTIPLYPNGADIPNCNVSTKEPACGNQSTPTHVLCNLPDEVDLKATPGSILCCDECGDNPRSTREKRKLLLIILPSLGGTVFLLMLSTCAVKYKWGFCTPHPRGLSEWANRPPPIAAYSFEDICKATNDFDASKKIGEDTFGVQYRAHLGEESLVVIKRLSRQSADRTNDLSKFSLESADGTSDANLQADMITLEIDDRPCQLKLKGTLCGPANQQELNGNTYGPSDRFSVYGVSMFDSWL